MKRLVLVLILAASGWADNLCYVSTTGDDMNNGSAPADDRAFRTIQHALENLNGSGTIKVGPGSYTETQNNYLYLNLTQQGWDIVIEPTEPGSEVIIETNDLQRVVQIDSNMVSGSLTINNLTIRSMAESGNPYLIYNGDDVSVALNSCILGDTDSIVPSRVIASQDHAVATRKLTITGCSGYNLLDISALGFTSYAEITISNNHFWSSAANKRDFIKPSCIEPKITIDNNIIYQYQTTSGQNNFTIETGTNSILIDYDSLVITNNHIYSGGGGIRVEDTTDGNGSLSIANNVIEIYSANTSQADVGIQIGGNTTSPGVFGYVMVSANSVTFTGTEKNHGILIGQGVTSSLVQGNYVKGGDAQFVVKGSCVLLNNTGVGAVPCLLKGAQQAIVMNNTFVATSGYCLSLSSLAGVGTETRYNRIINNIFALTGTAYRFIDSDYDTGVLNSGGHYVDYNCWYNGSESYDQFADIAVGNDPADFEEWKANWLTWAPVYFPYNDAHSINSDPQFVSSTDYRLKNKSPCFHAGLPSYIDSAGTAQGETNIGAWQMPSVSADFNNDGVVDLLDLSIFASQWLSSTN